MLDWAPFVAFVHPHQRFLLTTHIRPDGDGLGSALALADGLEQLGKQVRIGVASVIPGRYDFLDPRRRVERFVLPGADWRETDAVIVLDTGTWNQLGDFGPLIRELNVPKAVIDHHLTQDDLGALRFVDTSAEATGRLVYEALTALGPIPKSAAQPLLAALAHDTGWFRHQNTTPATFDLAAELLRLGAEPTPLYEQYFEQNSLAKLHLAGMVLQRMKVLAGGVVAYTEIHRDDYAATGALPHDTEDLVNYPRSLSGVTIGLLFMEQPRGGIKVSFRARPPADVAVIAERFGGGGHRLASGAVIEAPLDEARRRVLDAVLSSLETLPPAAVR